jgi:alkylation response protein AidB-like acyl-CoA dehydrogenase
MFELTKQQEMVRSMVHDFAEAELAPRSLALDEEGVFAADVWKRLGTQGIIGISASRRLGGAEAGHLAGIIAVEELARVYPSAAFSLEASQAPIYAIEHFGTEEQQRKYLPPVLAGDQAICIAATEPTGGSDLSSLGTEARFENDAIVVDGRKVYITNGGVSGVCLVLAKTGERLSTVIVEKGAPGFTSPRREKLMGLKSVHVSELLFTDCRVPRENLLGKEGGGMAVAMTSFAASRPGVGAVGLGIARGAFEIALKFAKERILYGGPIGNLQGIQFMLAEMETEIEKARWVIYYPGAALDRGVAPRDIGKHSARAKAVGAEVAAHVTMKAIQLLGGCGVCVEYHLARLLNDAMELFPATGTVEIMKVIQAREILR